MTTQKQSINRIHRSRMDSSAKVCSLETNLNKISTTLKSNKITEQPSKRFLIKTEVISGESKFLKHNTITNWLLLTQNRTTWEWIMQLISKSHRRRQLANYNFSTTTANLIACCRSLCPSTKIIKILLPQLVTNQNSLNYNAHRLLFP